MFGIGAPELVIIIIMFLVVLSPIILLIMALIPPKTANKGTIIAILIGPLAYIYVDKWGKALILFFLGWLTAGIIHLIIWPYSIFNIRTEVRRYNEEMEIHSAKLAEVRSGSNTA
ncbi:MAG: hypothetical protein HKM93_16010 [Desulfobacteraceae bacterium]|nr:hypothetical protein [Desulfobacteraceae bacterium]